MNNEGLESAINRLVAVMAQLRNPKGGCPWDLEQSFATIAPYTIEEAYEVADAIERQDMPALRDELGDLLLQVVFHAQMAQEAGQFDLSQVADGISEKMVRRHPHVFGDSVVETSEAQTRAWEDHKETERQVQAKAAGKPPSALDGVAAGLPALLRALKLQRRAARVGFDWPDARDVLGKMQEELNEIRAELDSGGKPERVLDEVGDLLFVCANLARHLDVDPEAALRHANGKFERRFRHIEQRLAGLGRSLADSDLDEMENLWQEAKKTEGAAK
ncbi:MAG: nucleoside triphosphate pyrophosphohydrolase [Dongiaceae bacterium]